MNKIKILALFGKSGAGKDTIQKWIVSKYPLNTNSIVPYTTRPPREGEINGIDYHFVTNKQFSEKEMLEYKMFREWKYGTATDSLCPKALNVGVFNIDGIKSLLSNYELDVLPVLIVCEDKKRLMRTLDREKHPDCEEICRRFLMDNIDFGPNNLNFHYEMFYNCGNSGYCDDFGILNLPAVSAFIKGIIN